ncbi:Conserved membrane-associated protein [Chlamydiales bacterium STE3]|nr:Conserved membrane-associated protein [Chlamydiales bacterium STE3]
MDTQANFVLFVLVVLTVLVLLIIYFAYSLRQNRDGSCPSPYTGLPLRKARELTFSTKDQILRYLYQLHDYDNRMFDIEKAALCRETGRLFPDAVKWNDKIKVDWSFIQKRYQGNFVSWGSLSEDSKKEIRAAHNNLNGFQTEYSSEQPAPRMIEADIALIKPGPLYVDIETKVLLGWKEIPHTELEVLIVQKPRKIALINVEQK